MRAKYPLNWITLVACYLPYARQDRICADGEAHSKQVLVNLLNNSSFDMIKIADLHSQVDKLHEARGALETVFLNGKLMKEITLGRKY